MGRQGLVRLGGISAVLGGLAWAIKGSAILLTGKQPPVLFEAAPVLLAVGLLALSARLRSGRHHRRAGAALAIVAGVASGLGIAVPVADGSLSPALLISTVALLTGLVVLGVVARRELVFGSVTASSLPLWVGIGTFPALVVGGALSAVDERLLELPLVLVGVIWAAMGVLISSVEDPAPGRRLHAVGGP